MEDTTIHIADPPTLQINDESTPHALAQTPPRKARWRFTPPPSPKANKIKDDSPEYSYSDVAAAIREAYITEEENASSICDILATYCRGQKILFTEAKTHCEQRLNLFMLPSIFVSVASTIVNLALKDTQSGELISACLSGFVAFILALINHMKLDGRAEAHRTSAYKFDKLESLIEFKSGKMLFDGTAHAGLGKFIEDVESNVREIRETNQYVLPESIRRAFPKLTNGNVFARVKQIGNREAKLYEDLKILLNRIKKHKEMLVTTEDPTLTHQLELLESERTQLIKKILDMQTEFSAIDLEFEEELKIYMNRCTRWFDPVAFMKV
jgi:hypothetical protein